MKFGKKGFTGIEIAMIIAIAGLALFFSAKPIGQSVSGLWEGSKNKQKQTHKVTEQYQVFYKDKDGNIIPAPTPYVRTEEGMNYVNAEPPETLWQKFWRMGIMAVVVIVVLSYLGILPIIRLWWNLKVKPKLDKAKEDLENLQEQQEQLSGDAKLIVRSVDEGLASLDSAIASAQVSLTNMTTMADSPIKQLQVSVAQAVLTTMTTAKRDFLSAMSRKQNDTTKLLVAELKND